LLLVALVVAPAAANGPDTSPSPVCWPQFRGPGGNGVAVGNNNLPTHFGPSKNVLWKTPLPAGHSSPCVWNDHIYLTGFDKAARKLETLCLDRGTGQIVWRRTAPAQKLEKIHEVNSLASPTPATDGDRVYVYFGSFGLLCYDRDGKPQWQRPLPVIDQRWGSGSSPIVAGELLVLALGPQARPALLALNRRTGATVWEKPPPGFLLPQGGTWSTPAHHHQDGVDEIIVPTGSRIVAYNLADGAERWQVRGLPSVVYSTPVVGGGLLYLTCTDPLGDPLNVLQVPPFDDFIKRHDKNHDGKISRDEIPADLTVFTRGRDDKIGNFYPLRQLMPQFDKNKDGSLDRDEWQAMAKAVQTIAAGVSIAAAGIRLGGHGDVSKTHVVWKESKGVPEVPTPLYYHDRVYLVKERGLVSCLDAQTGKLLYRERLGAPGQCYASPVAGDGKVYAATDRGRVVVWEAGDQFKVLARNDFGEPIMATPALLEGKLYIRTARNLYAIGEKP
jgi:outer membrane protein assembly factor BamB